jgi:hypothetical protein
MGGKRLSDALSQLFFRPPIGEGDRRGVGFAFDSSARLEIFQRDPSRLPGGLDRKVEQFA